MSVVTHRILRATFATVVVAAILTKWGVVGKVIFANLQEPSVSGKATDTCLQLLLSQRVQHHIHTSKPKLRQIKKTKQNQLKCCELFSIVLLRRIHKQGIKRYCSGQVSDLCLVCSV